MKEAIPASWRGVTGPDPKTGDVGVSFETDQGVLRLRLTLESARALAGGLADCLGASRGDHLATYLAARNAHSERSSGNPTREVSSPLEGE